MLTHSSLSMILFLFFFTSTMIALAYLRINHDMNIGKFCKLILQMRRHNQIKAIPM